MLNKNICDLSQAKQLMYRGKLAEALDLVESLENNEKDSLDRHLIYHHFKILLIIKLGDYKSGLKLADNALKESKRLGNPLIIVDIIILKINALCMLGRFEEGLNLVEYGENILKRLFKPLPQDIIQREASLLYCRGMIYEHKGVFDQALSYHEQSLVLRQKSGNIEDIAFSFYNIGIIYMKQGLSDRALEYLLLALSKFETINDKPNIASSLHTIGIIYSQKRILNKALEFLEKSLNLRQVIGNALDIAVTLLDLISILTENDMITEAEHHLETFHRLSIKERNNKLITQRYKSARALILKAKTTSSEEMGDYELTAFAILYLCDLFIYKWQVSKEPEILTRLKVLLSQLFNIAKKQKSHRLLAEAYWINCKLAAIEGNIIEAQALLTQTKIIIEEKGLKRLSTAVSKEWPHISAYLSSMERSSKSNFPLIQHVQPKHLKENTRLLKTVLLNYPDKDNHPLLISPSLIKHKDFNPIIHTPARLIILTFLYVQGPATFTFLISNTWLSSGNLSSHLKKLKEAEYIEIENQFVESKPQTIYRLTSKGKRAFISYIRNLKLIATFIHEDE